MAVCSFGAHSNCVSERAGVCAAAAAGGQTATVFLRGVPVLVATSSNFGGRRQPPGNARCGLRLVAFALWSGARRPPRATSASPTASCRPHDVCRSLRRATIARDGVSSRLRATSRHPCRTTLRLLKLSSALPIVSLGLRTVALQALHAAFHLRTDARRTRRVTCRTHTVRRGTRTATCRARIVTCGTRNVSRRLRRVACRARNATLRTLFGALQGRIDTSGARHASRTVLLDARRVRRDSLTTLHVALQRRRSTLRELHDTQTRANASLRRPNASLRKPNVTRRKASVARRRRNVSHAERRGVFPGENASLRTLNGASSVRDVRYLGRIEGATVRTFEVGDVIAGKYEVTRVLGQGGMGVDVAAFHRDLDALVALKVLLPSLRESPQSKERFTREARTVMRLRNEHVARVHDVGDVDGTPFIVMEYLTGEDLAKALARRGPLAVDEAVDLLLQACEAVAEAHKLGIVHRDLKPANLFVTTGSDGLPFVKVLDFGISKSTAAGDPP